MSLMLAHSMTYANYNRPLKLRVWGGTKKRETKQLLWESPPVNHIPWQTYSFQFRPAQTFHYIILEAWDKEGSTVGGNILLDKIGPVKWCNQGALDRNTPINKL